MFLFNQNYNEKNSDQKINQLVALLKNSQHTYAITGAGISTNAGIPDLQHLSGLTSMSLSSESNLENHPQRFYRGFHKIFIDPIFTNGPTTAHKDLAKLEKNHLLDGVVTTNVDYLHELAGNKHVADIWRNLNTNICIKCGKIYDIKILKQAVPTCPACGGLISPAPIYYHIAIDGQEYEKANRWMQQADLVIVVGSNGYYDGVLPGTTVVNINKKNNGFDSSATLNIRGDADEILSQVINKLNFEK